MKKFYSAILLFVTLLSCSIFSACGDKYKKLNLDFYIGENNVSSVNLVLDQKNDYNDSIEIGVKISGVKKKNIGDIIFEFPNTVGILSNQRQEDNMVFITLTAVAPCEKSNLLVRHSASGKTASLEVFVDKKSNDLEIINDTYIISIPKTGTNTHEIQADKVVGLLPSGSTDKVLFNSDANINEHGLKLLKEGDYIKGFVVEHSIAVGKEIEIYPVTKMEGYEDSKYSLKKITIKFVPTLSEENLTLVSDDKHMLDLGVEGKVLYDTIFLIAKDSDKATDDYCYNNVSLRFKNGERTENSGLVLNYLYDDLYEFEFGDQGENGENIGYPNLFVSLNETKDKVFIQAIDMNQDVISVRLRLVPKYVGDIETIEKIVKIKADVKPEFIQVKKGNVIKEDDESIDIFDVYRGELSAQMLSFIPQEPNSHAFMQNMRITVPKIMLNAYVSASDGVNPVFDGLDSTTQLFSGAEWRKNDKLISLYKNNSTTPLKFYFVNGEFVSESLTKFDKIYITYEVNDSGTLNSNLSMRVQTYYSGDQEYLKEINCDNTRRTILFNAQKGVTNVNLSAGEYLKEGANFKYTPLIDNSPNQIYLDINNSVVDGHNKYGIRFEKVFGENDDEVDETNLNVELISNNLDKPAKLVYNSIVSQNIKHNYNKSDVDLRTSTIEFKLKDGTETCSQGDYVLKISHSNGYELKMKVYIYDSGAKSEIKYSFDKTVETFAGYGDYIVEAKESLDIEIERNVPSWYATKYEIEACFDGGTKAEETEYYKLTKDQGFGSIYFKKGTYVDGIKFITISMSITYANFSPNLQINAGSTETIPIEKTFFVYEGLEETDLTINTSEIEVYSMDKLGVYDKANAEFELTLSIANKEYLWNYIQSGQQDISEHKIGIDGMTASVVWYISSDDTVSTESQGDKSIKLKVSGHTGYDFVVHASVMQFGKVFDNISCVVHVRMPVITEFLNVEITKTEQNKPISIKNDNLNIRDGVNYYLTAENVANKSNITNPKTIVLVVNSMGEIVTDVVNVVWEESKSRWKINLIDGVVLENGLKLLVVARDALRYKIDAMTSDLTDYNLESIYLMHEYKDAYRKYNLVLSDGSENSRYWIEYADDFWEITYNNNLLGKHFEVRDNISLTNTSYTPKRIDNEFTGSITTPQIGVDAVSGDPIYARYSLYGLKLDNSITNLFKILSGKISNVNFSVNFGYDKPSVDSNSRFGLIGTTTASAKLENVTVQSTGTANFDNKYEDRVVFGVMVGENLGEVKINNKTLVGVSGDITIGGTGKIDFGAVAGKNGGKVEGVIADDSDGTGPSFVVATQDQGAISNMTITSTLSGDTNIGGVVGYNTGKISSVYVSGKIIASQNNNVGGLIGKNETSLQTVKIEYTGSNYSGIDLSHIDFDVEDIKSCVVIEANNNVGGIVGLDIHGNYSYCRYQILDTINDHGIKANENVGGIAGSTTYGKFEYCSVYGYRFDYNQMKLVAEGITTFDGAKADIKGEVNVGGLIGNAISDYNSGNSPIETGNTTAVSKSSVNAFVESASNVGGMVGLSQITTSYLPMSHVYFMGKLSGSNKEAYSSNVLTNQKYYIYITGDATKTKTTESEGLIESTQIPWAKNDNLNAGYSYIRRPLKTGELSTEQPIFDIAPKTISVTAKSSSERVSYIDDKTINIDYYQSRWSVLDASYKIEQAVLDEVYNKYDLTSLFDFNCTPNIITGYRLKVILSDTNVVDVTIDGKLLVKGVGKVNLIFMSVLNSEAVSSINISVNYPISDDYYITNSLTTNDDVLNDNISLKQAKQYFVVDNGKKVEYDSVYYELRTNNDFGYNVVITAPAGAISQNIGYYLQVANKNFASDSPTSAEITLNPGEKFSIKVLESIKNVLFTVSVTPYVQVGIDGHRENKDASAKTFTISTYVGIADITLNYNDIVLYPNDETYIVANFTTDREILPTELESFASSADDRYLEVEFVSSEAFNEANKSQVARYKVTATDEAKKLTEETAVQIRFTINEIGNQKYIQKFVNFALLAQRIDNIDIKNYMCKADGTIDVPSKVLRPNNNGLMILDIVPNNGIFDHLEIRDVTGAEEIVFVQIDDEGGTIIATDRLEDGKGIQLIRQNGTATRFFVTTRISADYSSRIHTVKVTARSRGGQELCSTYYYIDVKMMPRVEINYIDPNGIMAAQTIDQDNVASYEDNKLYLANGVNADFYIYTRNSDGNIDTRLSFVGDSLDVNEFYTLQERQRGHYELVSKKYDARLMGKTLKIEATTKATLDNGTFEYESASFVFEIAEFVIHNISVNNTQKGSGYNYSFYGDYSVDVDLRFYFNDTDISFYDNGRFWHQSFEYKSDEYNRLINDSTNNTVKKKIYQIIQQVNENPSEFMNLNNNGTNIDWVGNTLIAGESINFTKDDDKQAIVLKVTDNELNVVRNSQLNLNIHLGCDGGIFKHVAEADANVSIKRNYGFDFTNKTSLLNMKAIRTEQEFMNMKSSDSGYYILDADLELGKFEQGKEYIPYSPIDVDIAMFDGNGHTITIYSFGEFMEDTINAGLFKQINKDMIVMNLNVVYQSQNDGYGNYSLGNVRSSYLSYADICNGGIDYTSVLFGGITPTNYGIVTNCKVSGRIALHASSLEVNANTSKEIAFNIGGLVGVNSGYITNSVSELKIYALANIGGLVYENTNEGKIVSSYFDASDGKGLIYGYFDDESSTTNAIEARISGFVVENAGSISMSYSTVGRNTDMGIGAMTIKDSSAGFVYTNTGTIQDCYVDVKMLGLSNNTFYGFVYRNINSINNSYSYVNGGGWSEKVRLFAPSGTTGLTNCVEFINEDKGYTIRSEGLTRVKYSALVASSKDTYTNFSFGDGKSSVWTLAGQPMPRLVSTMEKATGHREVRDVVITEVVNGHLVERTETKVLDNGYGTKDNPYIIYDTNSWITYMDIREGSQFNSIRDYYRLVADIDFSSITENLKTSELTFSGNIQGNNMVLSGFMVYSDDYLKAIGLFKEMVSVNSREISSAVRNLTLEAYSVLAVKTERVGVLAGHIENYNLYNISVSCEDVVLGGNVVGGLAGIIYGDFNIENIKSTVSVNANKRTIGGLYDLYSSSVNGADKYSNVDKVNFAGSVAGIVDGFDASSFDINNREVGAGYYFNISNVSVDNIVAIGENVGGMFGFVGERVNVVNAIINVAEGKITATRHAGFAVAENRGVLQNITCQTTVATLFENSNNIVGGVVGINFGGFIDNAESNANIIKYTSDNITGGIVGRNVGGYVNNSSYSGVLFGYTMGGIIGVDNSINTLLTSGTFTSSSLEYYDSLTTVAYTRKIKKNTNPITYETVNIESISNCAISKDTLDFWLENMNRIYRYSIDKQTNELNVRAIRCLGLCVGRYGNYTDILIYQTQDQYVFNKVNGISTETNIITKELGVKEIDGENYLIALKDFNLPGNVKYSYLDGEIQYFNIEQNENNVYMLLVAGSAIDNFDGWDNEFGKDKQILFLDDEFISQDKIETGGIPDFAPDPDLVPDYAPVFVVSETSLFGNDKYYKIIESDKYTAADGVKEGLVKEDITLENELEFVLWIDFISYYRIAYPIWIDYTGFVLNTSNDLREYIHEKAYSSFRSWWYGYRGDTDGDGNKELYIHLSSYEQKENCSHSKGFSIDESATERTFAVDGYTKTIGGVETGDQLTYIFEKNSSLSDGYKIKPICEPNTPADLIYKKAKQILNSICKDDDSDLEKARKIYEWMAINVVYDTTCLNATKTNWETYSIYYAEGALLKGYAVCDGISKAYTILCGIEGVPCIQVDGFPPTGSGHAWNQVQIEGNWYNVDVGPNYGNDEMFLFGYNYYFTKFDITDYNNHIIGSSPSYDLFGEHTLNHPTAGAIDLVVDSNNEASQLQQIIEAGINESSGLKYVYIQFKDNSVNISSINTAEEYVNEALESVTNASLTSITLTRDTNGSKNIYILEIQMSA